MSTDIFEQALKAEGVSGQLADIARSVYKQESGGGRNTNTSNAGAVGGMQIIPSTFKSVADKDWNINDPVQNARAGIRYLSQLNKQAGGDPALTAAGYYGGPGGMEKARKGIAVSDPRNPKAPNTLQYAQQVVGRLGGSPAPVPNAGSRVAPTVMASDPVAMVDPALMAKAPMASPEAPPVRVAQGPDPWTQFRESFNAKQPVDGGSLAGFGMPSSQVNVPNFAAAAQVQHAPVNFAQLNAFGKRRV